MPAKCLQEKGNDMNNTYFRKQNPIVKKIFLTMLMPTIFMNLTTAIASMADAIIIGQYLDDASLSVVTFAMPIFLIINVFSALFAVGGCITMSVDSGKGNKEDANKAFSISVELLASMGILLLLAGLFFSRAITTWLGAGEDVFELVELYSRIILLGGPFFVLNTGFAFFVRNDGRPTLSMIGMFASIFVDITLNFVFVGVMKIGVAGAAYSTVIGSIVSVLIISTHFFTAKNTLKFRFTFDSMVVRIVKNGGSAALQFIYQFVTVLLMNHFLTALAGTGGVVIYTVVINLSTVALSLYEGISQTIQPMVSNFYGEKSYRKMKEVLRLVIITILVICGSVTLLLEVMPRLVPMIFGIEDASLMAGAEIAVRIYATGMIITTINVVIDYYLQSIEQSFLAAVIVSLRSFVLFLGAVFVLGKLFGMNGIWAAYPVAEILTFIACFLMMRAKQKKLVKTGSSVNLLLLDETVEKGITCYTYCSKSHSFADFADTVLGKLAEEKEDYGTMLLDVEAYLEQLARGKSEAKEHYVETEMNKSEKKIIIRDNLSHADLAFDIQDVVKHTEKSDYGPVLGFNRLCLEALDQCIQGS